MADTIQSDDLDNKKPVSSVSQPPGNPGTPANQPASSQPGTPTTQNTIQPSNTPRQIGTQTTSGPQQQGTGYTNIQKIVQANQGNGLGQAVVGGIQQTGQQAAGAINSANQDFTNQIGQSNQQLQQGNTQYQGLLGKALNIDPNNPLSDADYASAQQFLTGNYSGPTELQNGEQVAAQAADAEQLGKLGGSEAGRAGLLQRFVGGNQYTQGQQKLDNLLLGSNSGAINQARSATQGLSDLAARGIQTARAQGQSAAATDAATRAAALAAGQTDITNVNNDLNTGAQNYLNSELGKYTNAQQIALNDPSNNFGLLSTNLTPQQKAAVLAKNPSFAQVTGGMSQDDINKMLTDYQNGNTNAFSSILGQTSAADQTKAGSYNALNKLLNTGAGTVNANNQLAATNNVSLNKDAINSLNQTLEDQAKGVTDQGYTASVNKAGEDYYNTDVQKLASARAAQYANDITPGAYNSGTQKPANYDAQVQAIYSKYPLGPFDPKAGADISALNKQINTSQLQASFLKAGSPSAIQAGQDAQGYRDSLGDTSQGAGQALYQQQLNAAQQAALQKYLA